MDILKIPKVYLCTWTMFNLCKYVVVLNFQLLYLFMYCTLFIIFELPVAVFVRMNFQM